MTLVGEGLLTKSVDQPPNAEATLVHSYQVTRLFNMGVPIGDVH